MQEIISILDDVGGLVAKAEAKLNGIDLAKIKDAGTTAQVVAEAVEKLRIKLNITRVSLIFALAPLVHLINGNSVFSVNGTKQVQIKRCGRFDKLEILIDDGFRNEYGVINILGPKGTAQLCLAMIECLEAKKSSLHTELSENVDNAVAETHRAMSLLSEINTNLQLALTTKTDEKLQ